MTSAFRSMRLDIKGITSTPAASAGCDDCKPQHEELKQLVDDILRCYAATDRHAQTLPGEFIQYGQHPEGPAIRCPGQHEVVAPDMVLVLRSQPDAWTVVEPKPNSGWVRSEGQ